MATTYSRQAPPGRLRTIQDALTPREWGKVGAMAGIVIGLNVLGWAMLLAATGHHYHLSKTDVFGLGTGVLAYTLGMRHAFDADHISAIDNTTRKLMAEGKRPLSVGFFFSLGHSTIVFLLAVLLNFGIRALDNQVKAGSSGLHQWTSVVGTSVSGFFLYLIAGLNIVILVSILRVFRDLRRGKFDNDELDEQLNKRGLMNRLLGRLRPQDRHARGRCTRSGSSSGSVSTPPPRSPCSCSRGRRSRAGCPSMRSCRCPCCSPPACACSTPWTAAS